MAVHPAVGVGFAPGGLAINATEPFWNNALFLLLLMPNWPLGLVHHFIGTDDFITAQVQETVEK